MSATLTRPTTNLSCQHGICIAQTGWMYESLGYPSAAINMYEQAVRTLAKGIAALGNMAADDALFHLGASQLRLGCLCQSKDNPQVCRQWIESALPNLRKAWSSFPGNPWYQQALAQAALMLGEIGTAEQVRDQSPPSASIGRISEWIDRALNLWARLRGNDVEYLGMTISDRDQPAGDWSTALMGGVFGSSPAWVDSNPAT
jgi:hypothetical protein